MAYIVKNSLVESIKSMYESPTDALIVEDNDTKHKCKKVKKVI